jgi:hypothetical protein
MARYRLYFINPAPRHVRDVMEFDAQDDAAAIQWTAEAADGRATELWQSERLVEARRAPGERSNGTGFSR